jgi:hypothetical protein
MALLMRSFTAAAIAGGDDHDDDRDGDLGQERHQLGQQGRDRVGAERPERDLQGEQDDRVVDDGGDQVRGVVLRLGQGLADPAALHGAVEVHPLQDRVGRLAQALGDQEPDQQDDQEQQELGHEPGDEAEPLAQRRARVVPTTWRCPSSAGRRDCADP